MPVENRVSDRLTEFMTGEKTPRSEELLDAAIECTFPASDPVAVEDAFVTLRRRERRRQREASTAKEPGEESCRARFDTSR